MSTGYNIELVPARLVPFDWSPGGSQPLPQAAGPITANALSGFTVSPSGQNISQDQQALVDFATTSAGLALGFSPQANNATSPTGLNQTGGSIYSSSNPLYPLTQTGGLVFPYNPTISESLSTKYDMTELTHTNESIHAFKNNDNVRIALSDCVWTSETFDQAIYTLGVIHFFRSYRLMDFGRGKTGRPPTPMWFSAYGNFMYTNLPVLIERVDFSFPADIDYVGVPNPGTEAYNSQTLQFSTSASVGSLGTLLSQTGDFTWIPQKFTIGTISMVVQNAIAYWTTRFDLAQFKAGQLVGVR
jgi:hypothetical protein